MPIADIKERTANVLRRHDVAEAYLFGSTARREDRLDSDVDILVRFNKKMDDLFVLAGVKVELEDALGGRKVDLIEMDALRKELRPAIERDKVRIV